MSYVYANNTRSVQQIVKSDGESVWLKGGKKIELDKSAKTIPDGVILKTNSASKEAESKTSENKE